MLIERSFGFFFLHKHASVSFIAVIIVVFTRVSFLFYISSCRFTSKFGSQNQYQALLVCVFGFFALLLMLLLTEQ